MAVQLKARIANKWNSARMIPGGGARSVVMVQAFIETDERQPRSFGPLEKEFEGGTPQHEIDAWLDEERRALEGKV